MPESEKTNGVRWPVILFVLIFSIGLSVGLSQFLKNEIEDAIYEERKSSLEQLIGVSAESVNDSVATQWEVAEVYGNDAVSHISDYPDVSAYLKYLNSQMPVENDYCFLVDTDGKYYCTDGADGKIVSTKYFVDSSDDRLEYLDSLPHFQDSTTYLILRMRFGNPLHSYDKNGSEIEIAYFCLMHDILSLNASISSLFDNNNNTMIFSTETGVMLYKQFGINLLVEGYNIYEKYGKVTIAHGIEAEDVIAAIKDRKSSVSMMQLEDNDYYLCSSPLDVSDWSLFLVVEGDYFNSTSDFTFTKILYVIAAVLAIAAFLAVLLFWYFDKLKVNRRILESEKNANATLKEAYAVKSSYLSYMSHDIRTPMNGIIGMSDIGIRNSSDPEKVEDCFKKIELSSRYLLAIVNDVLDMSAIEAGKVVIQNEKMNIVDTLSNCLDIIRGSLNNRQLNIEQNYECPNKIVSGDEFHLKQIIVNFLSNAVKFTPDGGTVRLSCRQLKEKDGLIPFEISVSDTGIGMTEEMRTHIFEAFRTAARDGKTKVKGSGLGMAISHEYVKLMNGTIKVESKLNKGSTFTVVIPFQKVDKSNTEMSLEDLHVLLVDDNDINLEITGEMLKDRVKSLELAHNGKEALDKFLNSKEYEYDLILMDVMMPVMNGLESTGKIRAADRQDSNIFILALTANTYKDDIDEIFASGMDGYLNKPFSVAQLIDKISSRNENGKKKKV